MLRAPASPKSFVRRMISISRCVKSSLSVHRAYSPYCWSCTVTSVSASITLSPGSPSLSAFVFVSSGISLRMFITKPLCGGMRCSSPNCK